MTGLTARFQTGTLALLPQAALLALRGQIELVEKGIADSRFYMHGTDTCVLVSTTVNGRDYVPTGVVTFLIDTQKSMVWINQAYVDPGLRGRGVYKSLYAAVKAIAHEHRCRTIESATHLKNTTMRSVAKRLGRTESFVILTEEIEVEPEVLVSDAG